MPPPHRDFKERSVVLAVAHPNPWSSASFRAAILFLQPGKNAGPATPSHVRPSMRSLHTRVVHTFSCPLARELRRGPASRQVGPHREQGRRRGLGVAEPPSRQRPDPRRVRGAAAVPRRAGGRPADARPPPRVGAPRPLLGRPRPARVPQARPRRPRRLLDGGAGAVAGALDERPRHRRRHLGPLSRGRLHGRAGLRRPRHGRGLLRHRPQRGAAAPPAARRGAAQSARPARASGAARDSPAALALVDAAGQGGRLARGEAAGARRAAAPGGGGGARARGRGARLRRILSSEGQGDPPRPPPNQARASPLQVAPLSGLSNAATRKLAELLALPESGRRAPTRSRALAPPSLTHAPPHAPPGAGASRSSGSCARPPPPRSARRSRRTSTSSSTTSASRTRRRRSGRTSRRSAPPRSELRTEVRDREGDFYTWSVLCERE